MTDQARTLEAKDKQEVGSPVEQTRAGLTFTPAVDIFETDEAITLMADMPGVKAEDLDIDLRRDTLTLTGETKTLEGPDEAPVLREFRTGRYVRQFALSDVIDQSRIEAEMSDGVLKLVLPKAQKAVPRKISVKAG
ncbi:MAG: Hsp20/alpha crystallin family protein [Deltaproteobacteria bacterium]|nr:Hsp20/alpha crystallin family protein [Deltaproteobacteria bacterium]